MQVPGIAPGEIRIAPPATSRYLRSAVEQASLVWIRCFALPRVLPRTGGGRRWPMMAMAGCSPSGRMAYCAARMLEATSLWGLRQDHALHQSQVGGSVHLGCVSLAWACRVLTRFQGRQPLTVNADAFATRYWSPAASFEALTPTGFDPSAGTSYHVSCLPMYVFLTVCRRNANGSSSAVVTGSR